MTSVVAPDQTGQLLARELADTLPTDDVACVVGLCGREDLNVFQQTADECEATQTPFFVVEVAPATLRISPVYGRAYGSCYHCRAEAVRASRGPFDHAVPIPPGWLPQHLSFAARAIAEVIERPRDPAFQAHRTLNLFDSTLRSVPSEGFAHA